MIEWERGQEVARLRRRALYRRVIKEADVTRCSLKLKRYPIELPRQRISFRRPENVVKSCSIDLLSRFCNFQGGEGKGAEGRGGGERNT